MTRVICLRGHFGLDSITAAADELQYSMLTISNMKASPIFPLEHHLFKMNLLKMHLVISAKQIYEEHII